ncbi:MAG: DEDD exonuclease domain-containing protein [Candidatus Nanopelagicales bacterium]
MTSARPGPQQASLDELGTPLTEVTFVVVDLETTGGSPADAGITEVGAVKVRAGEVLGEMQTLVDPGSPVPPFVAALTGITDAMLVGAPRVPAVLPAFLEFARGSVLVAHNAPYDIGFLKGACARTGTAWPGFAVVDTARLARQVLHRDEVPNCKLATLAAHVHASTRPTHRALDDARATVDVLHALLERVGDLGVHSLDELLTYSSRVSAAQRRKRTLAEGLPEAPGVYVFEDDRGRALYVGTSRNLRSRVRTYFTATEQRTRMAEMVGLAARVVPIVCATPLEAEVRELRLIAERRPRYNRRSRHPERDVWLKLTLEPFPRLSVVREVRDDAAAGAAYVGPFRGRRRAEQAAEALLEAAPLRTCTTRLSPRRPSSACALAEMGRCSSPCDGGIDVAGYAAVATAARTAMTQDARPVAGAVQARMAMLAMQERFEDAAVWRERLEAFARAADRAQRMAMLAARAELVAARPTEAGGWEVHVLRHGRLAGSALVDPGVDPRPHVEAVVAAAEVVVPGIPPAPAGLTEEATLLLRWLESPGVRLVRCEDGLALPVHGAGRLVARLRDARDTRPAAYGEDAGGRRTVARPVLGGGGDLGPAAGTAGGRGRRRGGVTRIALGP